MLKKPVQKLDFVAVTVHKEGIVVALADKKLIAKIGIDKQSGKEALVYYPVKSMKRVDEGWKTDIDEEHQISEKDAVDMMYGTKPKAGSFFLPVSIKSKADGLILGLDRAMWKTQGGRLPKLTPLGCPLPQYAYLAPRPKPGKVMAIPMRFEFPEAPKKFN